MHLLHKRKDEALKRLKLPELRKRSTTFKELAEDAIDYIQKNYSRPADDVARLRRLMERISGPADNISRSKFTFVIDTLAREKKWSHGTKNHYLNLLSLTYRLALDGEKVKDSPLRGLRRKEGNKIVRYLSAEEEKKLREAIRAKSEWAEHEPELDLAIHTGLRRGSMYIDLLWENVDLSGAPSRSRAPRTVIRSLFR
jgi:hypothetical protein